MALLGWTENLLDWLKLGWKVVVLGHSKLLYPDSDLDRNKFD